MSTQRLRLDFPQPARVLVVAPHPDDEVLGCGGCIALHRMQGDPVHVLVVFDGALGAGTASQREAECRAAGAWLLEPDYEFWRLPEGHVPSAHDQQAAVTRLVERLQALQPELIYLPWPEDAHPDHLVVAACVRAAVLRWLEREPDVACTLWGYEVWSDHAGAICVDTSAVHERKLRALACHASQLQDGALEAACRSRMERRARVFDGRAASAEAFLRVEPRAWQAG